MSRKPSTLERVCIDDPAREEGSEKGKEIQRRGRIASRCCAYSPNAKRENREEGKKKPARRREGKKTPTLSASTLLSLPLKKGGKRGGHRRKRGGKGEVLSFVASSLPPSVLAVLRSGGKGRRGGRYRKKEKKERNAATHTPVSPNLIDHELGKGGEESLCRRKEEGRGQSLTLQTRAPNSSSLHTGRVSAAEEEGEIRTGEKKRSVTRRPAPFLCRCSP